METTFTKRNSHGANLKRWREWRGIKQEVLADKIGPHEGGAGTV